MLGLGLIDQKAVERAAVLVAHIDLARARKAPKRDPARMIVRAAEAQHAFLAASQPLAVGREFAFAPEFTYHALGHVLDDPHHLPAAAEPGLGCYCHGPLLPRAHPLLQRNWHA